MFCVSIAGGSMSVASQKARDVIVAVFMRCIGRPPKPPAGWLYEIPRGDGPLWVCFKGASGAWGFPYRVDRGQAVLLARTLRVGDDSTALVPIVEPSKAWGRI
jgi:hypothetical protein